jgi:DNA-binding transcriptional regulator YbjK
LQGDRRTHIADAALRVLGGEGARGLTHRAVDAEATLPAGSTSYYCRRRVDLLALTLRRHAELDRRSLDALGRLLRDGERRDLGLRLARALTRWQRAQGHPQLVARFELFLACSRDADLRAVLDEQRAQFVAAIELALAHWGLGQPRTLASALIALIEGLLLERVRLHRDALSAAELGALISRVLGEAR